MKWHHVVKSRWAGIVGTLCLAKCMQMVYQQAFVIVSTVAAFWEYPSGYGIDPKSKSLDPR